MPATKTRKTITAASDPEAAALSTAAREIARAAGLTSGYVPSEGRELLDRFTVKRERTVLIVKKDKDEPVRVKSSALKAFVSGDKDADVAKQMAELAHGAKTMLYGRKLGAYLLAAAKR